MTVAVKRDLAGRIAALEADLDEVIEKHVVSLRTYGVPQNVITNLFWAKVPGQRCRCRAVLQILENGS